jgi:arylsulfatase A-like enzyme
MLLGRAGLSALAFGLVATLELLFGGGALEPFAMIGAFGLGGLVGVAFAGLWQLVDWVGEKTRVRPRVLQLLAPSDLARREAALAHARFLIHFFGVVATLWALKSSSQWLSGLQDAQLARRMGLLLAFSACLGFWALAAQLAQGLAMVIVRAPSIAHPRVFLLLRGTLLFSLCCVLTWPLLLQHGVALGGLGVPVFVLAAGALLGVVYLWTPSVVRRASAYVLLPLWLLAFASVVSFQGAVAASRGALSSAMTSARVLEWLRSAADFDGDGYSAWLDGGDCAPFDGKRNPDARETPGNKIDENCDGSDQVKAALEQHAITLPALEKQRQRPFNIVLIVIDSLRADHVHTLGYSRRTTPNLDKLAAQSWLFSQAYSQAAATQISFPAFFTGLSPIAMQWKRAGSLQIAERHLTLAQQLEKRGYDTAFLFNGWIDEHMQGAMRGFATRENVWPDRKDWEKWRRSSAASTLGRGLYFLEKHARSAAPRPFFLTLYFEDPHAPYEAYSRSDVPSFGRSEKDRYDQEIAFADRHVGVLLDYLRYRPELDANTILVVTADHGEEFREHGGQHHGHNCHVESTHVPLIVRIPEEPARRSDAPVGLIDIVPTLLERVGAPVPAASHIDGRSLRWALGASAAEARKRALFCTTFDDRRVEATLSHAVRRDGLLLMRREATGDVKLFDTREDPKELVDLAKDPSHAATKQQLEQLLQQKKRFPMPR